MYLYRGILTVILVSLPQTVVFIFLVSITLFVLAFLKVSITKVISLLAAITDQMNEQKFEDLLWYKRCIPLV